MKKTVFGFALLAAVLTVASCSKKSEYHMTDVPYPYHLIYADHTIDSLLYITTEVHTVTSDAGWCTVDNSDINSINEFIRTHEGVYNLSALLSLQPNTTGATRDAYIRINAGEYSSVGVFRQMPSLNVTRPMRFYDESLRRDSLMALKVSDRSLRDSVAFTVEGAWELSAPEGSFVTLDKTAGSAGSHVVYFTVPANTGDERSTVLELTSKVGVKENGTYRDYTIVDHITIVQEKVKAEE